MNKILTFLIVLFVVQNIYAIDIEVKKGWSLLGTETTLISMSAFNETCTTSIWTYNNVDTSWSLFTHDDTQLNQILKNDNISLLTQINPNDGFWVNTNNDCNITISEASIDKRTLKIVSGWQLKGTQAGFENLDSFNQSCIDLIWTYDENGGWGAYSSNAEISDAIKNSESILELTKIESYRGFWVYGNQSCSINNEGSISNAAPILAQVNNVVKAEDFTDFNITLSAADVDDTNLTYSALSKDISIATLNVIGDQLVISSILNASGVVTIDVNVTDGNLSDIKSFDMNVTAVDDAPTLQAITNTTTLEDSNITIDLNATDIENDSLTYTVDSNNTSIATVSIVNSKVVVTPIADANGVISIEVNATANEQTATQTFTLDITAVDDTPIFTSQQGSYGVQEDDSSYSVMLNATDIESDTFTFSASASNDKVTLSLVDNNLTITPKANANGNVVVDVNVTQESNTTLSNTYNFTVTINPVNDAPTVETIFNDISIQEDSGSTNYDLNVIDIEGDDVNVTVDSNDTSILTVTPNWSGFISQANHTDFLDFNLTTVANANGVAQITITVDDGDKNSSTTFDVNITVVNDAPVLQDVADQVKVEDFATYTIELNATDIDNTNLTYNALSNDVSKADVNVSGTTLSISSVANANGVVTIDINVTDGELSDTQSFDLNITAVDDAPVLNPIANQTQSEDFTDFNITLSASDSENDPITYTVGSSNPAIATVSIVNGKVVVTPIDNQFGNITVEVNATANGQTDTQTFTLDVTAVDDAPYFTSQQASYGVSEDDPSYSVLLNASDKENDSFRYNASASNDKVSLSLVDNNLTITPSANANGSVVVDVNVTQENNSSLYDTYSFTLTINSVNDKPIVTTYFDDFSLNEDSGISNYDLNISDIDGDDVKVRIDSNDTSILTVETSWINSSEWITQANHTDYLDFNLTTVANAYGVVEIGITIDDGELNSTKTFDVNVIDVNEIPIANAGDNQDINTLSTVVLNGFLSSDIENDILVYSWTITSKPNGSNATLSDETIGNPSFIADVDGYYVISLIVNDGVVSSDPYSIKIQAKTSFLNPPDTFVIGAYPEDTIDMNNTEEQETLVHITVEIPIYDYVDNNVTSITSGSINTPPATYTIDDKEEPQENGLTNPPDTQAL